MPGVFSPDMYARNKCLLTARGLQLAPIVWLLQASMVVQGLRIDQALSFRQPLKQTTSAPMRLRPVAAVDIDPRASTTYAYTSDNFNTTVPAPLVSKHLCSKEMDENQCRAHGSLGARYMAMSAELQNRGTKVYERADHAFNKPGAKAVPNSSDSSLSSQS